MQIKNKSFIIIILFGIVGFGILAKLTFELAGNEDKIKKSVYNDLVLKLDNIEESLTRIYQQFFYDVGQLTYDDRIKQTIFMENTRLFPVYQDKAAKAVRDFAIFKNIQNIYLFGPSTKFIAGLNRTLSLDRITLEDIKRRLRDYKEKQVIYQKLNGKDVVIFIMRLNYSQTDYAYVVIVEDLYEYTRDIPEFTDQKAHFYAISRDLEYQNIIVNLIGRDTNTSLAIQKDTLIKYSLDSADSFNVEGQETLAKVIDVKDYQYFSVLGMLNPEYTAKQIRIARNNIILNNLKLFIFYAIALGLYLLIRIMNYNVVGAFKTASLAFIEFLKTGGKQPENASESGDLLKMTQEAQKLAYSYINKDDNIKDSVFKVYNTIKKLPPEDIRNMSIKNSLSKENIRLVYQPIVDSKTLKPQLCEVFLRLLNYYGEELMPSEFIPVLSHFNLLESLDEMMLEKVIRKVQSLQAQDPSAKISINISKGAFNSDKFLEKLNHNLSQNNIHTENIMLELPFIDLINGERSESFIQELTNIGITFAVSVMSLDARTIKKIIENRIKYIKIDMMHFADLLENKEKQRVLKEILANSKKHDIQIIAERIETEIMFKLAKSLDIGLLQGYYISKPKKYYTHK